MRRDSHAGRRVRGGDDPSRRIVSVIILPPCIMPRVSVQELAVSVPTAQFPQTGRIDFHRLDGSWRGVRHGAQWAPAGLGQLTVLTDRHLPQLRMSMQSKTPAWGAMARDVLQMSGRREPKCPLARSESRSSSQSTPPPPVPRPSLDSRGGESLRSGPLRRAVSAAATVSSRRTVAEHLT